MGDRYVITSAECTINLIPNKISVLVGDTTLGVAKDTPRFFLNVSDIKQHPEFDNNTYQNNIAVLVLSSPVDLKAHPNIKPACLPTRQTKSALKNGEAVFSGWGTLSQKLQIDGHSYSNLFKLGVKILPDCRKWQG